MKLLRTVIGVAFGYALMVVLITLVQETWLGGVGWDESPMEILIVAGALTCMSGAVGGSVAAAIARPTGRLAAVIMSALVVAETTSLIVSGKASGPLLFDVAAGGSLAVAILAGGEVLVRFAARARRTM